MEKYESIMAMAMNTLELKTRPLLDVLKIIVQSQIKQ